MLRAAQAAARERLERDLGALVRAVCVVHREPGAGTVDEQRATVTFDALGFAVLEFRDRAKAVPVRAQADVLEAELSYNFV